MGLLGSIAQRFLNTVTGGADDVNRAKEKAGEARRASYASEQAESVENDKTEDQVFAAMRSARIMRTNSIFQAAEKITY